uniref:Uncharacterized protein n=1 Tax=Anguilla anguilla TaxID=7936 RepID=A0A0E9RK72_ANGAN
MSDFSRLHTSDGVCILDVQLIITMAGYFSRKILAKVMEQSKFLKIMEN